MSISTEMGLLHTSNNNKQKQQQERSIHKLFWFINWMIVYWYAAEHAFSRIIPKPFILEIKRKMQYIMFSMLRIYPS